MQYISGNQSFKCIEKSKVTFYLKYLNCCSNAFVCNWWVLWKTEIWSFSFQHTFWDAYSTYHKYQTKIQQMQVRKCTVWISKQFSRWLDICMCHYKCLTDILCRALWARLKKCFSHLKFFQCSSARYESQKSPLAWLEMPRNVI